MITPTNHCPHCPLPTHAPKPHKTHRYGDYIILRPDAESRKKLSEIGKLMKEVIQTETNISPDQILLNDPENFHLTLAMPLKPMKREELLACMRTIKENAPSGGIQFDVIFRGSNDGGNYGFAFSSPNYAPGFDIRLNKAAKDNANHPTIAQHAALERIAAKVQAFCESNDLVDTSSNADGKCNTFKPHISLGKFKEESASKAAHIRAQHTPEKSALSHLVSKDAGKLENCPVPTHKFCNKVKLKFEAVEILRVDAEDGGSHKTTKLSTLNLSTKEVETLLKIPGCEHKSKPEKAAVPMADYSTIKQEKYQDLRARLEKMLDTDPTGSESYFKSFKFMAPENTPTYDDAIYVRFYNKEDALKVLKRTNPGEKVAPITPPEGFAYVRLGAEEMMNIYHPSAF